MKTIVFAAPRIKRYETDEFHPSGEPRFVAVSLKGVHCQLHCDHCGTHMLTALYRAESPDAFLELCETLHTKGCRGMLLTGGCDRDGTIPLPAFVEAARAVRERFGFRYAVHTKLVTPEFARAAAAIGTELLMSDVVGEDQSIQEIYHLTGRTVKDVETSLDCAESHGLALAPHILIGIARGKVEGEFRALELLRGRRVAVLCLVVLTPLRSTPLAGTKVDVPRVLEVLTAAREVFADTPITLGCAKTGGETQRQLEEHALALGFDAIAYPSEGIVEKARAMGRPVRFIEACCSFLHWGEQVETTGDGAYS